MDNKPESQDNASGCAGCHNINWWATLIIAVLAVPSLGAVVVMMSGIKGFFGVSMFIVACWFSTYLGMRLMHSKEHKNTPPKQP